MYMDILCLSTCIKEAIIQAINMTGLMQGQIIITVGSIMGKLIQCCPRRYGWKIMIKICQESQVVG